RTKAWPSWRPARERSSTRASCASSWPSTASGGTRYRYRQFRGCASPDGCTPLRPSGYPPCRSSSPSESAPRCSALPGSTAEQAAQDEEDVLLALAETPVEVGEPVRPVGDIDPHPVPGGHQLLPAPRTQPVEHLELEARRGELPLRRVG